MDTPLLSGYCSSSSFQSTPVSIPSSLPDGKICFDIQDYHTLKMIYDEVLAPQNQDRLQDIFDLRIHLEDFKRPIFKSIEENEFAMQASWLSSFNSFGNRIPIIKTSKKEAARMILKLLERLSHLETLDIMLFSELNEFNLICHQVDKLTVSAGYFEEFERFWKSCKAIKTVILDGIIPRLNPQDMEMRKNMHYLNFQERSSIELLNITRKSIITEMQFRTLLKWSPNLSHLYYEKFASYLQRDPQKIKNLLQSIISDEKFIDCLKTAYKLEYLSFYVDERQNPKFGILTLLDDRVKKNLKGLVTTSQICHPTHLSQFTGLLRVIIFWRNFILPTKFLDPSTTIGYTLHEFESLPKSLLSIQLYFFKDTLQHEALKLEKDYGLDKSRANQMYAENLSRILEFSAKATGSSFALLIAVTPYLSPIQFTWDIIFLGTKYEKIYNALLPLLDN